MCNSRRGDCVFNRDHFTSECYERSPALPSARTLTLLTGVFIGLRSAAQSGVTRSFSGSESKPLIMISGNQAKISGTSERRSSETNSQTAREVVSQPAVKDHTPVNHENNNCPSPWRSVITRPSRNLLQDFLPSCPSRHLSRTSTPSRDRASARSNVDN
jgi:hypothetical protein